MLLCDNCNGGYHLFCLKPKFTQIVVGIWYCSSCSLASPWFLLRPCHVFFLGSGLRGIHENFISAFSCVLYIYVFWLINFYLWLVLVFLFSRVYYEFTPLWHWKSLTTRHNMIPSLTYICQYIMVTWTWICHLSLPSIFIICHWLLCFVPFLAVLLNLFIAVFYVCSLAPSKTILDDM
jgi:hypothetical protein